MANNRKLTNEMATSIRHLYKDLEYTYSQLCYIFNVSRGVIQQILYNVTYGDADYNPAYIPDTPLLKYYNKYIKHHINYHHLTYEQSFKPIDGFSHYKLCVDGTVFSDVGYHYTKVKSHLSSNGYLSVLLWNNNHKMIKKSIHTLIAKHFLTNDNNLPCVLHKNDNKLDNTLENLYFGDYKDNRNDMVKNGRYIYRIPQCCKEGIKALIDSDPTISNNVIAKRIGLTPTSVRRIRKDFAETNNNN